MNSLVFRPAIQHGGQRAGHGSRSCFASQRSEAPSGSGAAKSALPDLRIATLSRPAAPEHDATALD